ncbi:hypothetical protein V6N13_054784 [Hibiscus sabdariffa]|uniref:AMP-dependent synthetase/ligase domain-containing protein n=1 Tax=Hibiscus sabdariffa TaxID=183260 RepID=A0ABR2DX28_9ROSI
MRLVGKSPKPTQPSPSVLTVPEPDNSTLAATSFVVKSRGKGSSKFQRGFKLVGVARETRFALFAAFVVVSLSGKVDQSDTAAILYSSGTTERVKGVMMTHRNLIARMAVPHIEPRRRREREAAGIGDGAFVPRVRFLYAVGGGFDSELVGFGGEV